MKIIFEGDEIREIVEAYRAEHDPDNDVPYVDLLQTLLTSNKNFKELLLDIAQLRLLRMSVHNVFYMADVIKELVELSMDDEPNPNIDVLIKSMDVMPGTNDLVIEFLRYNE